MTTQPKVCWTEIAVKDMDKAVAFYNEVFQWDMKIDNTGPNPLAWLGGDMDTAGGHIYPGTPGANGGGSTVHIIVPDKLENAVERCKSAGGTILGDPIEIPPGRFSYAIDPDGNSLGLFEPKAA